MKNKMFSYLMQLISFALLVAVSVIFIYASSKGII